MSLLLQGCELLCDSMHTSLYCIPVCCCQPGTIACCELVRVPAHELLPECQLDVCSAAGTCAASTTTATTDRPDKVSTYMDGWQVHCRPNQSMHAQPLTTALSFSWAAATHACQSGRDTANSLKCTHTYTHLPEPRSAAVWGPTAGHPAAAAVCEQLPASLAQGRARAHPCSGWVCLLAKSPAFASAPHRLSAAGAAPPAVHRRQHHSAQRRGVMHHCSRCWEVVATSTTMGSFLAASCMRVSYHTHY